MPEITLIHHVAAKVEKIFPFFNEMDRFIAVHPVIYKSEMIEPGQYRLYEKLDLKLFKVSFSYTVRIEKSVADQQVIMFSEIRKGVELRLKFDFQAKEGTTQIHETVTFNAPAIICPLFLKFLTKQHKLLITNVASTLGGTQ